jgi:hypothetical protein
LVEHLVDADERGADHVPVDVLERELEVEGRHEAVLE